MASEDHLTAHGKVENESPHIIPGEKGNVRHLQVSLSKKPVTTHGERERERHLTTRGEKAKGVHLITPGGKVKEHLSQIIF